MFRLKSCDLKSISAIEIDPTPANAKFFAISAVVKLDFDDSFLKLYMIIHYRLMMIYIET